MTPAQNLWSALFNFGPAIYLGIALRWWVGLVALAATFLLGWFLFFLVSVRLPPEGHAPWAWLKGPFVATFVMISCLAFFKPG